MSALDITPDDPRIVLVLSPARSVRESNLAAVREVTEKGVHAVVVTVNQPARSLARHYRKNGIDMTTVRFIDTVTKYAGGDAAEDMPGSVFLHRPDDLTGLSIAITGVLKDPGEQKICIIVDSVNAMLIYISSADLLKFIHYLASKLKILEISGIFLAMESGLDPALLARLTAISDDVIESGMNPWLKHT
ncbi:MAG: hypothetical protein PHP59_04775 [Methanofollis sp.]|uniref:DUF7504 family protein n=1 Tax=Methanofollis sp. TaxID=2052835 RepID=UPI00260C2A85|nr:hypothetical protein [Methanofollis sp.]MDD4254674.1 hypothetical protein [Methanofollis sp.]